MIPPKNRDRKCSTCKHYQPSPLWRKGWCRNPLLYDRNTNHLVEADSLACNRTFIDYWEPVTGPTPGVAPQARSSKPRIAPSIPIGTTDAKGNRGVVTGNTPASGMAAAAHAELDPLPTAPGREVPRLSLVTPDYQPGDSKRAKDSSKVTRMIEQIEVSGDELQPAPTAAERIRQARKQRPGSLSSTRNRIILAVVALAILLASAGGGFLLLRGKQPSKVSGVIPTPSVTRPIPTPTGYGDATATPVAVPTPVPPPAGTLGANGWAQVKAGGGLSMRAVPAKGGAKVAVLPDGTVAKVGAGPKDADGVTWWKLDVPGKGSGWCAGQYLTATSPPH